MDKIIYNQISDKKQIVFKNTNSLVKTKSKDMTMTPL